MFSYQRTHCHAECQMFNTHLKRKRAEGYFSEMQEMAAKDGAARRYLTDAVDAHVSAFVSLIAWSAISDSISHFFRKVFIRWTAVQFTGVN